MTDSRRQGTCCPVRRGAVESLVNHISKVRGYTMRHAPEARILDLRLQFKLSAVIRGELSTISGLSSFAVILGGAIRERHEAGNLGNRFECTRMKVIV